MCDFFSCIVKKDKTVIWEDGIDNHHELLEKYNIPDNTADQNLMEFARIEILPPNNEDHVFEKDLSLWGFKIDERYKPVWFSPAHEESCLNALKKCLKECIFDGVEIKRIENKKGVFIRRSKIDLIINSDVVLVRDNATINDVRGNATINNVRGNATINNVWDNATINNVTDNATINDVWDNAAINDVWGNATINDVWDNAAIRYVRGNATINNVTDNATIKYVWGNATINVYSKTCKFDYSGNGIVICRYDSQVKIYSAADIKSFKRVPKNHKIEE